MTGVTTRDREAAERLATALIDGASNYEISLAFAAHRIAALEDAAKAVEAMRVYHGMEPEIARIIRNLKGAGA